MSEDLVERLVRDIIESKQLCFAFDIANWLSVAFRT